MRCRRRKPGGDLLVQLLAVRFLFRRLRLSVGIGQLFGSALGTDYVNTELSCTGSLTLALSGGLADLAVRTFAFEGFGALLGSPCAGLVLSRWRRWLGGGILLETFQVASVGLLPQPSCYMFMSAIVVGTWGKIVSVVLHMCSIGTRPP